MIPRNHGRSERRAGQLHAARRGAGLCRALPQRGPADGGRGGLPPDPRRRSRTCPRPSICSASSPTRTASSARRSSTCSARPSSRRRWRCFTPISARCCGSPAGPSLPPKQARRALEIEPNMAGGAEQSRRRALRAEGLRGGRARAAPGDRRQSRISPRRTAISAMRCTRCSASTKRSPPIAAPSSSIPTMPTPGPISAPRCITAAASTKASSALRRAIALAPHHANAHSGLGILLLMRGDFGEGWDEYEWRLRSTERKGPRFPGKSLAGRKPRRQAHLRPGRAGFRRYAAIRPLHPAARRARRQA